MSFTTLRNHIPNAITSMNLLCGCLAVVVAFSQGQTLPAGLSGYQWAYVFIALAAVADFLDGFVARLLNAVSGIGKELDSLCDLVSFGLAPAIVLYVMMTGYGEGPWALAALLLPVFGAWRLAHFNVDTRQATTFTGLPIPGNAIFWIGFTAYYASHHLPLWVVLACVAALCVLMVCPLRMFSLKMHNLKSISRNWAQYLLIILAVALLALIRLPGLAALIVCYVVLSIIKHEK